MTPKEVLSLRHHRDTPPSVRVARAIYYRSSRTVPVERCLEIAKACVQVHAVHVDRFGALKINDEHAIREAGGTLLLGAASREERWEHASAVDAGIVGDTPKAFYEAPARPLLDPESAAAKTPIGKYLMDRLAGHDAEEDLGS